MNACFSFRFCGNFYRTRYPKGVKYHSVGFQPYGYYGYMRF